MRDEIASRERRRIDLRPLGVTIGAEVGNVDLAQSLDDDTFAEVEQALLDYKVLVFRRQRLDGRGQQAFARRFGRLEAHPFLPSSGSEERIVRFEKSEQEAGIENIWHADVTWRERPAMAAVLRAVEVPDVGGDTLFADMAAAYEGLRDEVKSRVQGLTAVHDFAQSFGLAFDADALASLREEYPPVEHPVVRTHPVTGKKVLFVNAIFTSHIVGLGRAESDELLEMLCAQAAIPEYQCRLRWERGTVALWDNRAVQHYAVSDYWPRRRVMERVAVVGDRPR